MTVQAPLEKNERNQSQGLYCTLAQVLGTKVQRAAATTKNQQRTNRKPTENQQKTKKAHENICSRPASRGSCVIFKLLLLFLLRK